MLSALFSLSLDHFIFVLFWIICLLSADCQAKQIWNKVFDSSYTYGDFSIFLSFTYSIQTKLQLTFGSNWMPSFTWKWTSVKVMLIILLVPYFSNINATRARCKIGSLFLLCQFVRLWNMLTSITINELVCQPFLVSCEITGINLPQSCMAVWVVVQSDEFVYLSYLTE